MVQLSFIPLPASVLNSKISHERREHTRHLHDRPLPYQAKDSFASTLPPSIAPLQAPPQPFRVHFRAAEASLLSRTPTFQPLLQCLFLSLCFFLHARFVYFQHLPASFAKRGGYGYGGGRQARQKPITRPTFIITIISKLRTLVLLFKPLTLYFQQVPNSFAKKRGVVCPRSKLYLFTLFPLNLPLKEERPRTAWGEANRGRGRLLEEAR